MTGTLGIAAISVSLAAAFSSMLAYTLTLRRSDARLFQVARLSFHISVVSFLIASAILLYLILSHQYQYTYVFQHTSGNLSRPLQFAAFYAGQEGSFMLWTLMTSIIGVFVFSYSQRVGYESHAMVPFMLVLTLLLVIVSVKSPFFTIFQSFPDQKLPADFIPKPRGLNPQLENLWITIHPPILFMGFAAMTVPFVFAVAGLLKRDYQRWITISLPWTLFASMSLGFGIMLGGWWAYETLGWGGFWAWDPVENSSLIPWLSCVALVHTMLVQKRTGAIPRHPGEEHRVGGLVRTNIALAVVSWGLILYSTFLTRSGVLGDTSVHSFVSPGGFVYAVLVIVLLTFLALGFGLLAARWKELRQEPVRFELMSRENALGLGSAVLLASATIVLIGTSWPLLMPIFDKPKVAVPVDFYNNLHLPIAFAIVLLNGLSMRLKWKHTDGAEFARGVLTGVTIAAIGTIGLVLLGISDPLYIALGFGSLLAIVVNVQVGYRVARGNPRFIGAYISHAGISLMMLGIIFTARYTSTEHVRLPQGSPQRVFDYTATYLGPQRIELEKTDREKFEHVVQLVRGDDTIVVRPVTFLSDFNRRESAFLEPGILYYPSRDVYVSPKALEDDGGDPIARLRKGERAVVPYDSSITVRFEKFDMSRAQSDGIQSAVVEVVRGDTSFFVTADYMMRDGSFIPKKIAGTDISVGMAGIVSDEENLANSQVVLAFKSETRPPAPSRPVVVVDVSIKPFISFVWAGVVIMVGGFLFAIVRRRGDVAAVVAGANLPTRPVPGTDPESSSRGVVSTHGLR